MDSTQDFSRRATTSERMHGHKFGIAKEHYCYMFSHLCVVDSVGELMSMNTAVFFYYFDGFFQSEWS